MLREVFDAWGRGLDGVLGSFTDHCTPDIRWWNSARGAVEGLAECQVALRTLSSLVGFDAVNVKVRSMHAVGSTVYVERSDAMLAPDGSEIADPPVFGVIEFEGGRITEWRDCCDDWLRDYLPAT